MIIVSWWHRLHLRLDIFVVEFIRGITFCVGAQVDFLETAYHVMDAARLH